MNRKQFLTVLAGAGLALGAKDKIDIPNISYPSLSSQLNVVVLRGGTWLNVKQGLDYKYGIIPSRRIFEFYDEGAQELKSEYNPYGHYPNVSFQPDTLISVDIPYQIVYKRRSIKRADKLIMSLKVFESVRHAYDHDKEKCNEVWQSIEDFRSNYPELRSLLPKAYCDNYMSVFVPIRDVPGFSFTFDKTKPIISRFIDKDMLNLQVPLLMSDGKITKAKCIHSAFVFMSNVRCDIDNPSPFHRK